MAFSPRCVNAQFHCLLTVRRSARAISLSNCASFCTCNFIWRLTVRRSDRVARGVSEIPNLGEFGENGENSETW